MSKPRELYHDDIVWVPKSAADKLAEALEWAIQLDLKQLFRISYEYSDRGSGPGENV